MVLLEILRTKTAVIRTENSTYAISCVEIKKKKNMYESTQMNFRSKSNASTVNTWFKTQQFNLFVNFFQKCPVATKFDRKNQ